MDWPCCTWSMMMMMLRWWRWFTVYVTRGLCRLSHLFNYFHTISTSHLALVDSYNHSLWCLRTRGSFFALVNLQPIARLCEFELLSSSRWWWWWWWFNPRTVFTELCLLARRICSNGSVRPNGDGREAGTQTGRSGEFLSFFCLHSFCLPFLFCATSHPAQQYDPLKCGSKQHQTQE